MLGSRRLWGVPPPLFPSLSLPSLYTLSSHSPFPEEGGEQGERGHGTKAKGTLPLSQRRDRREGLGGEELSRVLLTHWSRCPRIALEAKNNPPTYPQREDKPGD